MTTTDRAATATSQPPRDPDAGSTRRVAIGAAVLIAALGLWIAGLAFTAEPRDCDALYREVQAGAHRHNGNELPVSCR